LFLINLSFCFTDLLIDAESQYTAGWLYIAVFCGNIAVHLSLIIFDGVKLLIKKIKVCCMKKNLRKVNNLVEKKKKSRKNRKKIVKKRIIGKPEYNKPIPKQIKKEKLS